MWKDTFHKVAFAFGWYKKYICTSYKERRKITHKQKMKAKRRVFEKTQTRSSCVFKRNCIVIISIFYKGHACLSKAHIGKTVCFGDLYFIWEYYPHFKTSIGLRKDGPYSNLWTGARQSQKKKKWVPSNKIHTAWKLSKTVTNLMDSTSNWKRK